MNAGLAIRGCVMSGHYAWELKDLLDGSAECAGEDLGWPGSYR